MRRAIVIGVLFSSAACGRSTPNDTAAAHAALATVARVPELAPHVRARGLFAEHGVFVAKGALDVRFPARSTANVRIAVDDRVFVELAAREVRDVGGTLRGSAVVYPGAIEHGALVFAASDRVEDLWVLDDARAPRTFRQRIVRGPGVSAVLVRGDRVEVVDAFGTIRITTLPAVAFDAHGTRRAVSLALEGDELVAKVDLDGLAFPVVVDPAWVPAGAMPSGAVSATLVKLDDGRALLAAGGAPKLWDPSAKTWEAAGTFAANGGDYDAAVGLASGKVLVAGGATPDATKTELFDPSTKTWTETGALATARDLPTLTRVASGKVLLAGGSRPSLGAFSTSEIYDPSAGTWSAGPSMAWPRDGHTATLLASGKVLVVGGGDPLTDAPSTAELYDPDADAFSPAGTLSAKLRDHRAVLLASGKVLVARGAHAELYDPGTNAWTAAATPPSDPSGASLTKLGDDTVLLAGGLFEGPPATYTADAWLYDPGADAWAKTTAMASARARHAALLLGSGAVLVAGGVADAPLTDAELFLCAGTGTSCTTTCTTDADCASSTYCEGGSCAPKKANGATAAAANECASGVLAGGVCCDRACDGACEACNLAATKGTCTAAVGVECAARTCKDGVEHLASTCDEAAACPAQAEKICDPYVCDGNQCRTTCRSDVDCKSGFVCDEITHVCQVGATCDGDHTVIAPSGTPKDCSPLKCAGARCLESCSASTECVDGYVCDPTTKSCVVTSAPAEDAGGGCTAGAHGSGANVAAAALLAAGLALVVRARRAA